MNKLLHALISDQKKVSNIYKAGPYWHKKTLSAVKEIEKNGLNDFRSSSDNNTSAVSFGDVTIIDARRIVETSTLSHKIVLYIINHTPLKKLFDFQVELTRKYFNKFMDAQNNYLTLGNTDHFLELIDNYKIENSVNFGCSSIINFKDKNYSQYYLQILDLLDFVEKNNTLKKVKSFLEIGPGFGVNVHLIEQNYSNIRKFIIIDIIPNIWIVTEYLKNLYGDDSVIDYLKTSKMKSIKFKEDDSLEIFVIPMWEIEKISSPIDCFWNSNSFVEMPKETVKKYANSLTRIRTTDTIYNFISYDKFDLKTTFHPNLIPELFPNVKFEKLKNKRLLDKDRDFYFYLGKSS